MFTFFVSFFLLVTFLFTLFVFVFSANVLPPLTKKRKIKGLRTVCLRFLFTCVVTFFVYFFLRFIPCAASFDIYEGATDGLFTFPSQTQDLEGDAEGILL